MLYCETLDNVPSNWHEPIQIGGFLIDKMIFFVLLVIEMHGNRC